MIEGLHIDVPADEMKELLLGRLKYHQDRRAFYEKKVEAAQNSEREEEAERENIQKVSNSSYVSPLKAAEDALRRHTDHCIYFEFMAKHVPAGEVYRLGDDDLRRLGVRANNVW